jgi:hypothetical protein
MKGVEIVLNGIVLRTVSNLVGLPLILNGTNELISGMRISVQEYAKVASAFERVTNSAVVQKIKKIYKILRDKD